MERTLLCLIFLCVTTVPALGFYLPGVAPQDYAKVCAAHNWVQEAICWVSHWTSILVCGLQGDKVVLKVNKLTSIRTQLPYEYYSMPYCRPEKILPSAENLGEVLRGDRIENSPYEARHSPLKCTFSISNSKFLLMCASVCFGNASREVVSWRETDSLLCCRFSSELMSSARPCARSMHCQLTKQKLSRGRSKMITGC